MVKRKGTICLVAVAATFIATVSVTPQTRALVITRVNVADVLDGRILPNSTVTISGNTITSVTGNSTPAGAQVVDGQGKFLIPGLWDMHAHMEASGASSLQLYVANGVTGIRDMGSALDLILKMREATSSGRVLGPRIFAAGPILDDAPGDWPFRMRVKTAEDGRAAVQLLKRRGVDLIKVHDHTPRDAFFAIAEEARRQNLPLAGHVPLGLTVENVIDAGQRDIEHLSNQRLWRPCSGGATYSPEACRPFFAMLARRDIWQTPTLVATSEIATIGTPASAVSADHLAYASRSVREMWAENQGLFATPEVVRAMRAVADVAAVVTKDMAKAGVGILAGCDTMIAGFCVHDELAAMVRGGMTPLAALQTATLNPARYFSLQQTLGSVAPGQRADLVLLDANPLTDISNVRRIRAVVMAGRLLDRKELDNVLARVKIAAKQ
ncbi:MAG: amidohydrolase family protein [Acidobacteria bacterium]|nr:amidohydrolase family protein [Acidobacteriota bacterium]